MRSRPSETDAEARPRFSRPYVLGITFGVIAALSLLAIGGFMQVGRGGAAQPAAAELQTWRVLGKAYYERGEYKKAAVQFKKVVASASAVALDHLDLAQALIQTNQLNQALEELNTAKQMAPRLLAVNYNLGILYKHELRYPLAEVELKRVAAADPGDPPTWFNLGDVYFSQHQLEPALNAFERVVTMGFAKGQNFYVAATFHCFIILTRLRQPAEAQRYLKLNMATRNRVPGISLQYPALEAGKYGSVEIAPAPLTSPSALPTPRELSFADISSSIGVRLPRVLAPGLAKNPLQKALYNSNSLDFARRHLVPRFSGSVAVGDYNGDGRPDLYVVVPGGQNHLLHNNGNGTFTDVTSEAGVVGHGESLSAEFVDYDNSGRLSLVVAGLGGLTLYKNEGNGTFTDVTEKAGLKGNACELDTGVKAVDTDNDGLVDFVVAAYANVCRLSPGSAPSLPDAFPAAVSHLYHNDGDGTFRDVTASSGLEAARGHMRQVVFADFNNDGYMDLLFLRDYGPPLLFLNQGDDKFVDGTPTAGPALARAEADEARVSDFNHDGNFDLALWGPRGYEVLLNSGGARFTPVSGLPSIQLPRDPFVQRGAVADLDGNSFDDLLVKDNHGRWHALLNHLGRFEKSRLTLAGREEPEGARIGASLAPAWLSHPGELDLISVLPDGQMRLWARQGAAPRWVEVKLLGYKSNKAGVGDIVELKAGNFYDKVLAHQGSPVRIFTGNLPTVDVVRVTWPNQVVENSLNVPTDTTVNVLEASRLASSCPFLYVWNGKRFVFATDIMGVAPLGELAPDGTTVRPNPRQLVRLGSLEARDGDYVFQITDELREVDYFDQLRLMAVDHPASESVYANEIYSTTPAAPKLYFVRQPRLPITAVDDRGDNILPLIRYADGRYPTNFQRNRILGLGALHSITLNLGSFPPSAHGALWLQGWVFWTDSNASRALMDNHRLTMIDPYLQVRDHAGKWVTVIPDIGLPAGTGRTMRVDLTGKFLSSDHHVRIVTNLCVYWDRIFFTTDEAPASASFVLPLISANLHYRGFSQVKTDPSDVIPDFFDYARLMTSAPWNPARGRYTRYGPVRELLLKADDQLVTMASGDEMTVKFSARHLPALRPGWKRDFFLYAVGYAKDGEPNTLFSRTVAPMPFRAMSNYPPPAGEQAPSSAAYRRYLRQYETRPGYKVIPPLAPPH